MVKKLSRIKVAVFHQCAEDSFQDAKILLESKKRRKKNGAVYLAGFSLECDLKYSVFSLQKYNSVTKEQAKKFKHNLRELYEMIKPRITKKNPYRVIPQDIDTAFTRVDDTWDNDLRYVSGAIEQDEARKFVEAVEKLRRIIWETTN